MTPEIAGFAMLTVLALFSATTVVFHRKPVVCALALAFNLVAIAGFYLLLSAQFLALMQVIVYAGAIMVLILFVLMLLNLPDEERLHKSGFFQTTMAPIFALATAGILGWSVVSGSDRPEFGVAASDFGTVASVGHELFTRFFYAFEAISLLLIVAMIGAVLLAKRRL